MLAKYTAYVDFSEVIKILGDIIPDGKVPLGVTSWGPNEPMIMVLTHDSKTMVVGIDELQEKDLKNIRIALQRDAEIVDGCVSTIKIKRFQHQWSVTLKTYFVKGRPANKNLYNSFMARCQ